MRKTEFSKEAKQAMRSEIRKFFFEEREEEISDLEAMAVLEFVQNTLGIHIYNQAVEDAYALMSDRVEDLYGLQKRRR